MASILIRKVDERTKKRLRIRAATNGHSMEEEAREILTKALNTEGKPQEQLGLGTAIRQLFAPLGGVDLPEIPREPMREPPDFSK